VIESSKKLVFDQALLPGGWQERVGLTIDEGVITTVTIGGEVGADAEHHAIGLPGMANLHSHAFQRAMAGLAERRENPADDFWSWRDLVYRLAHTIGPDDLRVVGAMAQVEMLECGFTRVGEFHYLHHDQDGHPFAEVAEMSSAIFAAAVDTGIGLTHLPVFYAHAGFGGQAPEEGQRRFVCDLDRYALLLESCRELARQLPDAIVGIAPHSLRAVTSEELDALAPLAAGAPIHIHIAEQLREVEECRAATGANPVTWLLDHAPVSPEWCLVHATHVDEDELHGIARSGAVAGLCPITEANLGDGIFPATTFADAGGSYGIGTDSNVLIDMTEELRLLEYGQRLTSNRRNALIQGNCRSTGRSLYQTAARGGAQALGCPTGLVVGAPADIVSLRSDHIAFVGRRGDHILDSFIFAAGAQAVDCVWRRGERVVSQGRHRRREEIERQFRNTLPGLIA
jgi:formimidoylglutamate deiminase